MICEDTGIGIKEEDQSKLFQLFGFVESSEKVNKNGIGLGLHISKQIIESFNGNISFTSKFGVGTRFEFTFEIFPMLDQDEL